MSWDSIISVFTSGADKLAGWNLTQRLFWYAVLSSLFAVLYFIALPRYDCASGHKAACAAIDARYLP